MTRRNFLILAVAFEGGLAVAAVVAGWFLGINPVQPWSWDWAAVAWGLGATLPLLGLFQLEMRIPWRPLQEIREFLRDHLGPLMAQCAWYELLLIAALAGLGEEVLFRGLLQPLMGVGWSNLLFGLAHCVTPMYAVIVAAIGAFLGWLRLETGNLLPPVVTHATYDFVAFLLVVADWRRSADRQGIDIGYSVPLDAGRGDQAAEPGPESET